MYQTLKMFIEENKEEGRREGEEKTIIISIQNLMKTKGWTAIESMQALSIPQEEYSKYQHLL